MPSKIINLDIYIIYISDISKLMVIAGNRAPQVEISRIACSVSACVHGECAQQTVFQRQVCAKVIALVGGPYRPIALISVSCTYL